MFRFDFYCPSLFIDKNACGLGIVTEDDVVLAVDDVATFTSRLVALPGGLLLLGSGNWSDVRHFLQIAQYEAEMHALRNKEDICSELLAHRLSVYAKTYFEMQRHAHLDATLLCASWSYFRGPKLLKVDGMGLVEKVEAFCCGRYGEKGNELLAKLDIGKLSVRCALYKSKEVIDGVYQSIKSPEYLLGVGIVGKTTDGLSQVNPTGLFDMPGIGEIIKTDTTEVASLSI